MQLFLWSGFCFALSSIKLLSISGETFAHNSLYIFTGLGWGVVPPPALVMPFSHLAKSYEDYAEDGSLIIF